MRPLTSLLLVAIRDFKERVMSRAFQFSTGLTILLVIAVIVAPSFFDSVGGVQWTIGTVGEVDPAMVEQVTATAPIADVTVDSTAFDDLAAAETALEDGDVDIVVAPGQIVVNDATDPTLMALVDASLMAAGALDRAATLGLSPGDLADLLTGDYEIRKIGADGTGEASNRAFAFGATVFLFISIITYGQWILIGVIEEKTNRVVEVVLGAVRPHTLLAGKILGIGVLGLAQLIVVGGIALVGLRIQDAFDVPTATAAIALAVFVWFVLGFAFYATAYAAAGSLVSRQEEAQNVAFPMTILLMIGYFVASFSLAGENTVLRIASLLPPFAPMTMPMRMASGEASVWELTLSLTLMVCAVYLLIRLAGKIYSGALLRSGAKVKLRDAWRAAEG